MGTVIISPHDKVFRASLKNIEVAREYFEKNLPEEVLRAVNLDVLEPCPEIYINQHLKLSEADIVYKTQIAGSLGYLCLAAEHQAQGEVFMPLRTLAYEVAIWEFHRKQYPHAKKLPLIVTMVFYTGKSPYPYSTDFKDLLDAPKDLIEAIWGKPFTLVQVRDIPDEMLLNQKWAGLFQYMMKKIRSPDLLEFLDNILSLIKPIDAENAVDYIEAVVNYGLAAGEISDIKNFIETLKKQLSTETGRKIMTGAEQLIEMGKKSGFDIGVQQGIQQGMRKGIYQGEKELLVRQLTHRFSVVPTKYLSLLENYDSDALLMLGEKILDAKTLDELFED